MAKAPRPQAMPSDISRKMIVTSFGSSTGVRNLTMLAAPAMPNARASELPMMIIIIAPETHSRICACCIARPVGPIGGARRMHRGHEHADQRGGDQLDQRDERLGARRRRGREARTRQRQRHRGSRPAASAARRRPAPRTARRRPAPSRPGPSAGHASAPRRSCRRRRTRDRAWRPRGSSERRDTDRRCGRSRRAAAPRCAPAPAPARRGCRWSAPDADRRAGRSTRSRKSACTRCSNSSAGPPATSPSCGDSTTRRPTASWVTVM